MVCLSFSIGSVVSEWIDCHPFLKLLSGYGRLSDTWVSISETSLSSFKLFFLFQSRYYNAQRKDSSPTKLKAFYSETRPKTRVSPATKDRVRDLMNLANLQAERNLNSSRLTRLVNIFRDLNEPPLFYRRKSSKCVMDIM
jgi:hypothetical protein